MEVYTPQVLSPVGVELAAKFTEADDALCIRSTHCQVETYFADECWWKVNSANTLCAKTRPLALANRAIYKRSDVVITS